MNKDFYHFHFLSMSTNCTLQIYEGSEYLRACEAVKQNTLKLEKKYNFYDKNSYLNKVINNRTSNKIKIDAQSANVLKQVKSLSQKVNFLFDISVGTYKHCYLLKNKDRFHECLNFYQQKSGFDSWDIKNRHLSFSFHETKLDLGGVIKEFAVDEAAKILKEHKITSAIINFGGDIYAIGSKPNGKLFNIGVKNPKNKQENLFNIQICNQAITTSANYERSYNIENEEFSHILSKKQNCQDILSATAVSNSTLTSGIYTTSFMIDTNIDIPEDLKVALIDKELKIHQNIYT